MLETSSNFPALRLAPLMLCISLVLYIYIIIYISIVRQFGSVDSMCNGQVQDCLDEVEGHTWLYS